MGQIDFNPPWSWDGQRLTDYTGLTILEDAQYDGMYINDTDGLGKTRMNLIKKAPQLLLHLKTLVEVFDEQVDTCPQDMLDKINEARNLIESVEQKQE